MRFIATAAALVVLASPAVALACDRMDFEFRASGLGEEVDRSAPGPVVVHGADVIRRIRPFLQDEYPGPCGNAPLGHGGAIRLELEPALDETTPRERLGYRLELVEGTLPEGFRIDEHPSLESDGQVLVWLDDPDDDAEFHVRMRLIPVDEAGNEGTPSEPFDVRAEAVGCSSASGVGGLLAFAVVAWAARRRR